MAKVNFPTVPKWSPLLRAAFCDAIHLLNKLSLVPAGPFSVEILTDAHYRSNLFKVYAIKIVEPNSNGLILNGSCKTCWGHGCVCSKCKGVGEVECSYGYEHPCSCEDGLTKCRNCK